MRRTTWKMTRATCWCMIEVYRISGSVLSRILLARDLGGDPDGDAGRRDGTGGHGHGSEHGVFADIGACKDGGVIGHAGSRTELRGPVGDVCLLVDVVGVAVDVGVVGDAGAVVEDDLSAVIEQDVLVDRSVVPGGEVVAEGELHVVEDLGHF